MSDSSGKDYGYDRLYEAVVYKRHTVRELLAAGPELLKCINYSGETVMHWFVVENDVEVVELLSACGGQVTDYAITEACSLGHVDMVYLLMGIGVVPNISSCRSQVELGKVPRRTVIKLKRAFNRYGYQLMES